MRAIFFISVSALLTVSNPVAASEPIKCYEKAWAHQDNAGLGLPAGLAVELCSGATDADKVIQCFVKAWAHPKNGGLGLPAGPAVKLCQTSRQN